MAQLHYGDQHASRQVADFDHDDTIELQGEGYGVVDPQDKHSISDPPRPSSEAPLQVHHKRNDPFTADKQSPVDAFAGSYGNLEAQKDAAGKVSSAGDYGDLEEKQGADARGAPLPASDCGGQPNQAAAKRKDERYTSLGIEESQDENTSEISPKIHSAEGDHNMKERQGNTTTPSESMVKELEDHSGTGGGTIDVQSLKQDYVDLSKQELPISDDTMQASPIDDKSDPREVASISPSKQDSLAVDSCKKEDSIDHLQQKKSYPKQEDAIDDHMHEYSIDASVSKEDAVDNPLQESPIGDSNQKEDSHDPREAQTVAVDGETSSGQGLSSPDVDIQDVLKKVSGFDIQDVDASERDQNAENVPTDEKSPYSEVFKIDRSAIEEDGGLTVDSEDIGEQDAGFKADSEDKDVGAKDHVPSGSVESPYTEYDDKDDYVKVGYGAEGFVPKQNEDVERELREASEKVDEEEGRRPTEEHPLGASLVQDSKEEEGDEERNGNGEENKHIEVPKRPPSLPHPQPEDILGGAATLKSKKGSATPSNGDACNHDGHEDAAPKKGVLEKIKEKLTPPFTPSH